MPGISLALMAVAGLVHVVFFIVESLLWDRPQVHRIFGVRTSEEAATMGFALFNQGFYNLFLGLGTFVGIGWSMRGYGDNELVVFCALFMIGAAVVLVASNRKLWRGALVQGALPALAMVLALVV